MDMNIGNRRECFFDSYLVDTEKTTAEFLLHEPVRRETVLVCDKPWEGDGSTSQCICYDGKKYRMYYIGRKMKYENKPDDPGYFHLYAESDDGLKWIKPNLGIYEYEGSKDNNILSCAKRKDVPGTLAPLYVFYDTNPDCPENEKFKAIYCRSIPGQGESLRTAFSADGIHFDYENEYIIERGGHYDSMHACFWDEKYKKYFCYFRGQHLPADYEGVAIGTHDTRSYGTRIRDIRVKMCEDFKKGWGDSFPIRYEDKHEDIALYENHITPYFRAPHIKIGFPTRYNELRRNWSPVYDELTGREHRLERFKDEDRFGLAITDCTFMASHNGLLFKRYTEPFLRPNIENGYNWIYGGVAYPASGIVETKSSVKGEGSEISIYTPTNDWHNEPTEVSRFTIRLDGFASLHAGGKKEETIVTKPFIFSGKELFANLATSAFGYLKFKIEAKDGTFAESYEIFGDATDKHIPFESGSVEAFSGKEVIMTVKLRDADLYAIKFE